METMELVLQIEKNNQQGFWDAQRIHFPEKISFESKSEPFGGI